MGCCPVKEDKNGKKGSKRGDIEHAQGKEQEAAHTLSFRANRRHRDDSRYNTITTGAQKAEAAEGTQLLPTIRRCFKMNFSRFRSLWLMMQHIISYHLISHLVKSRVYTFSIIPITISTTSVGDAGGANTNGGSGL